jgi:hypothetical protein
MSSPSTSLSGHVVSVTPVKQKYTNWCWAACCEMFAKHHGFTRYDQYQFVATVLGGKPPDTDGRDSTSIFNSAAGPKDFIALLRNALPTAKYVEYVDVTGQSAIRKFLDDNRIMMYGSGNHAKILCGYGVKGGEEMLVAIDPEAAGPVPVAWTDFNTCAWIVYRPKS